MTPDTDPPPGTHARLDGRPTAGGFTARELARLVLASLYSTGVASAAKTHTMGVRVVVGDGESARVALRRLKKAMHDASVQYELDWHAYYISPGHHRQAAKGRAKQKKRAADWRQRPRECV